MAWEVLGPRVELTILLNDNQHSKTASKYLCSYQQTWTALRLGQRSFSLQCREVSQCRFRVNQSVEKKQLRCPYQVLSSTKVSGDHHSRGGDTHELTVAVTVCTDLCKSKPTKAPECVGKDLTRLHPIWEAMNALWQLVVNDGDLFRLQRTTVSNAVLMRWEAMSQEQTLIPSLSLWKLVADCDYCNHSRCLECFKDYWSLRQDPASETMVPTTPRCFLPCFAELSLRGEAQTCMYIPASLGCPVCSDHLFCSASGPASGGCF